MHFRRIHELVNLIPENSNYFSGNNSVTSLDLEQSETLNKFLCAYKDLSFGFRFVKSFIKAGKKMPSFVREKSLRDLYNFEKYNFHDFHLLKALALKDKSNQYSQNVLEALLLVPDITIDEISERVGLEKKVIALYEELFFNVLDRRNENLLISEIVYPEHRLVEMYDNYIKNESLGMILKRAGYNNGIDDVLYLSGLDNGTNISSTNVAESSLKLEAKIMSNGYFLARNGFLNQRNANGLNNAKNLLAAGKQGGADSQDEDIEGLANEPMGLLFYNEAVDASKKDLQQVLDARSKIGGEEI